MNKIKLGTLTIRTVLKRTIRRYVASVNALSFMSSVKGTLTYWKLFLYDVLAMVK